MERDHDKRTADPAVPMRRRLKRPERYVVEFIHVPGHEAALARERVKALLADLLATAGSEDDGPAAVIRDDEERL